MNRLLTRAELNERFVNALIEQGAHEGLTERQVIDGLVEILNQIEKSGEER